MSQDNDLIKLINCFNWNLQTFRMIASLSITKDFHWDTKKHYETKCKAKKL